jgi:alkanesulfonate monooxygenase SsuD/methylene tetrahydromethanopterin reductase-like flavin-dependent oxidoreductase (luciferase family)
MAEHHFQPEGTELIPNVLMMAMHLCGVTKNLKIGCGFNIVPMWHPLRLAADYAMADILTGGRVIFGVGRGYHTREVETFGAPLIDQNANREMFEEGVEILFKCPPGPYLAALSDQARATLREHVRRGFLCNRPDGPRSFASTAWACRGTVPS